LFHVYTLETVAFRWILRFRLSEGNVKEKTRKGVCTQPQSEKYNTTTADTATRASMALMVRRNDFSI
jgi:hypothetical protein